MFDELTPQEWDSLTTRLEHAVTATAIRLAAINDRQVAKADYLDLNADLLDLHGDLVGSPVARRAAGI
jgi:hypothetical protein